MQKSAKKEMLMQHELGGECEEHWNCMSWLVCTEDVCSPCERSEECQERHGSESICFEHMDVEEQLIEFKNLNYNVCKHKPLMFPFVDWVSVCVCVCVCVCGVCLLMFFKTHTHIYIHTHTHIQRDIAIIIITFATIALSAPTGTGGGGAKMSLRTKKSNFRY
jgi:hypothetical protein